MRRLVAVVVVLTLTAGACSDDVEPTDNATAEVVTAEDRSVVDAVLRFARDPSLEAASGIRFADTVRLGLGSTILRSEGRGDLADPDRWVFENADHFRGSFGPQSILDRLGRAERTEVSVGDHPHCVSPPMPAPTELEGLRRVSVQPAAETIASCLEWWTVDLYLTERSTVAGITLDFWEP